MKHFISFINQDKTHMNCRNYGVDLNKCVILIYRTYECINGYYLEYIDKQTNHLTIILIDINTETTSQSRISRDTRDSIYLPFRHSGNVPLFSNVEP